MSKHIFMIYIFFVVCIFVPSTAHAYLDPGTGNALIYVLLSLLGAVFYFIKGFFYKIVKSRNEQVGVSSARYNSEQDTIVIFNEGKTYWNTFKPVVEKLIEKNQKFIYYTMDIEDPCLQIANRLMDNRYIGDGNLAYSKIGNLNANVVLSTTPNIGTKGYPIPRSKGIKKLVHVFHGFDDLSFLHRGSLDHYDTVLLMGEFEIPIIRKLETLRNLPAKELIPGGLPYMDELLEKAKYFSNKAFDVTEKSINNNSDITVLLAPSYGEKGFLYCYGTDFIEKLAKQGFNLILRPHPQSFKFEKKLLRIAEEKLKRYKNIEWDYNPDGSQSFQKADILISDTSGVRIDFAFVYEKPFITMPISFDELQDYEIVDLGESWTEKAIQKIGYTLSENEIQDLDKIIWKVLREKTDKAISEFRTQHIYNLGSAGEVIADYLIAANDELKRKEKSHAESF